MTTGHVVLHRDRYCDGGVEPVKVFTGPFSKARARQLVAEREAALKPEQEPGAYYCQPVEVGE